MKEHEDENWDKGVQKYIKPNLQRTKSSELGGGGAKIKVA